MRARNAIAVLLALLLALFLSTSATAASITAVSGDDAGAMALAQAMVADPDTLTAATFTAVPPFGTPHGTSDALSFFPTHGPDFAILTSGNVFYADDDNVSGSTGDDIGGPPVPGRGQTAFDVTTLQLTLQAPAGANCLRLDFAFYSDEFPEYVGSVFNDAFIAELDQSTWTADLFIDAPDNFAFDPEGNVISVNSTGATSMSALNAAGTTYDGATVLLEAATQVTPGQRHLYLSIFDQGDHIYDSAVFVDDIRFESVADPETQCRPGAQPQARVPLILLPGIGGTAFYNEDGEQWPRAQDLYDDPVDAFFLVLRLDEAGAGPFDPDDTAYTTVETGEVLMTRTVNVAPFINVTSDFYQTTVNSLVAAGYQPNQTLFLFPYDWRKSVVSTAGQLITFIDQVRAQTDSPQVDIMAHSLGGLVTRAALADGDSVGKVRRVLTLGTPVLGAAKMLGVLEYRNPCFVEAPIVGCRSNPETVQAVVTNFPSVYQILPGPAYDTAEMEPLLVDRDVNSDGDQTDPNEGPQDYARWSAVVAANRNAGLMAENLAFHTTYDNLALADPAVEFFRIVGDSHDTPVRIREYRGCVLWFFSCDIEYEIVKGNGDGTVSLHSADLFNPDTGFDFRGGLPNAYAHDVNHGDLVKNEAVLDFVVSFFGVSPEMMAAALAGPPDNPQRQAAAAGGPIFALQLDDTPQPLAGVELEALGALDGVVVDLAGNPLGRYPGDPADHIHTLIPGGSYDAIGRTQSFFLNDDGAYLAALQAAGAGGVRLRLRVYADDAINGQAVFHVNAPAGAVMQLAFSSDPDLSALLLLIDLDGDGEVDLQQPPDSVVLGPAAGDTTPAVTTAALHLAPDRHCSLTLTAVDEPGGSGVAATHYRLDDDETTLTYTGPFTVPCGTLVRWLSLDRAGNSETIRALQTVAIDIKPGSEPNPINLGAPGVTPVAILSGPTFDATTVDPADLALAGAPVATTPTGQWMASAQDINGDGLLDLLIHVRTANLQLDPDATEALLTGFTADGTPLAGVDAVVIVP